MTTRDWNGLAAAGWKIERIRSAASVPAEASKDFPTVEDAIAEWASIVGQDPNAEAAPAADPLTTSSTGEVDTHHLGVLACLL